MHGHDIDMRGWEPFSKWIVRTQLLEDNRIGDLAADIRHGVRVNEPPRWETYRAWQERLSLWDACDAAYEALASAWFRYTTAMGYSTTGTEPWIR